MRSNKAEHKSGSAGKRRPRNTKPISGRISPQMYEAVIEVVDSGLYVDVTDYLRDVIRKDLEERGVSFEAGGEEEEIDR